MRDLQVVENRETHEERLTRAYDYMVSCRTNLSIMLATQRGSILQEPINDFYYAFVTLYGLAYSKLDPYKNKHEKTLIAEINEWTSNGNLKRAWKRNKRPYIEEGIKLSHDLQGVLALGSAGF